MAAVVKEKKETFVPSDIKETLKGNSAEALEMSKTTKVPHMATVVKEKKETFVSSDIKETVKGKTAEILEMSKASKVYDMAAGVREKKETLVSSDIKETVKGNSTKTKDMEVKVDKKEIVTEDSNDNKVINNSPAKKKLIPLCEKADKHKPSNVAVPRKHPPLAPPALEGRPLVLATHLVPSLPTELFKVFVEVLEAATQRPVVLLYEFRTDRPVAKDVTDIAILPAGDEWKNGVLLPVSFIFEHRLNKEKSPSVYVDVVIAGDLANVEELLDLRGHRCAIPDRKKVLGATGVLFSHLKSKGENPAFFGNILEAGSQKAVLQMVAGKQAEIGVLEAPVINSHKRSLPGAESVSILASLGPLPPYKIMVNKTHSESLSQVITSYLLNLDKDEDWMDKFQPYGILGFAKSSKEQYDLDSIKSVVTSVPYY